MWYFLTNKSDVGPKNFLQRKCFKFTTFKKPHVNHAPEFLIMKSEGDGKCINNLMKYMALKTLNIGTEDSKGLDLADQCF